LEEGSNVENLQAQRCRARIDHLDSVDVENITEWNNTKLKRILVDYMLRMSYFETATKLSESSNIMVSLILLTLIISHYYAILLSWLIYQNIFFAVSFLQAVKQIC
jgi:hypothetical protein